MDSPQSKKLSLSIDLRLIIIVLLVVIAGMLAIWQPWSSTSTSDRTVIATGEATVSAVPDEFVFYPTYESDNPDADAAIKEMSTKSEQVTAKLKELGVAESKIASNASGNDYQKYMPRPDGGTSTTYSLSLTITVDNKELAQKVQDYLLTTTPTGSVSPQASFSDAKRKELESTARNDATKDARAKADQMATNLGFKVGSVKDVTDGSGFGAVPYASRGATDIAISAPTELSLQVQPGENDLHYSVTVTYFIK